MNCHAAAQEIARNNDAPAPVKIACDLTSLGKSVRSLCVTHGVAAMLRPRETIVHTYNMYIYIYVCVYYMCVVTYNSK